MNEQETRFESLHDQLMTIPEELRDELVQQADRELKADGTLDQCGTNMEEDCAVFERAIELYLKGVLAETDHVEPLWFDDPARLRLAAPRYADAIKGRMAADRAADDSDAEIERTLGPCVGGNFLVPLAKRLRDDGVSLVEPLTPIEPYKESEVCDYFKAKDFVDTATPHTLSLLVVDGASEDIRRLASQRLKSILREKPELNAMLSEGAALVLAETDHLTPLIDDLRDQQNAATDRILTGLDASADALKAEMFERLEINVPVPELEEAERIKSARRAA